MSENKKMLYTTDGKPLTIWRCELVYDDGIERQKELEETEEATSLITDQHHTSFYLWGKWGGFLGRLRGDTSIDEDGNLITRIKPRLMFWKWF